jgi:DNA-binding FrmR family transcriptional regulator
MYPSEELRKQLQRDIHSRLKKIEGQIRGLQGMIDAEKDCEQILIQARAAQSALKAVCNLILKVYLVRCYAGRGQEQNAEEVFTRLDQAINMLSKFVD